MSDARSKPRLRKHTIVLIVLALAVATFCWQKWATLRNLPNPWTKLTVMPLRGGAYWLKGGVSNTGFVVGDTGVIVIDTQMFEATAHTAMAAIATITPKPIRQVILTHVDPDHINGLPAYPNGIDIIAQANMRARLADRLAHPGWSPFGPPSAIRQHMPNRLVNREADLVFDGVPIHLIHVAPAHTDGDLVVYLPRQRVVYAGDILTPSVGPDPGLHMDEGGSSAGWIRFVQELLRLDADIYVSGHGWVLTKAEVQARLATGIRRRAEIKAMIDRGMTLPQIKAALHDPPPTAEAAMFPSFPEDLYEELRSK